MTVCDKKNAANFDIFFLRVIPKFWFILTGPGRVTVIIPGSVLLRFTKIPGVFQVFSRLILNFPGVKTIPILSIADRISYKYVCYLS